MAKYDPLRQHLAQLDDIEWTPSFNEIEQILGRPLPASATQHRTWWANSGGLLVHQEAWLNAGWRVEAVEMSRRQVTFRRKGVAATTHSARVVDTIEPAPLNRDQRNGSLPKALRKTLEANRKTVNLSARIDWTDVGVGQRGAEGWRFPPADNVPALCRFHIFTGCDYSILVFVVPDLAAFLHELEAGRCSRTDDPSYEQALGDVMVAIAGADVVVVDAATPGQAWILVDGRGRKADLTDEDECWLVARAAAVVDRQAGHRAVLIRN